MTSIAIMTAHSRFPWLRQIVGGDDTLDGVRFTLETIARDCELLVVYEDIAAPIATVLPRERRLLILSEPPGIKQYRSGFLEQFGTVMGPVPVHGYSGRKLLTHPALPWFFGITFAPAGLISTETVDSLMQTEPPPKIEAISVILSKKAQLPKHRARLRYVEALESRIGDRLHVFGRGFRDIADKAEAILPYAYHLVLENNDIDHFWTEKTADAYLGWSLPLFSGCANIGSYFPDDSFIPVDISDPARSAAALSEILETHPYRLRLSAIREARRRILGPYNLFPILHDYLLSETITDASKRQEAQNILPNRQFSPVERVRASINATLRRWLPGARQDSASGRNLP